MPETTIAATDPLPFAQPVALAKEFSLPRFASVALFPVVVAIEIARDGTSHNLFPFEFVMFAFLAMPAVLGAAAGAGLRRFAKGLRISGEAR